jgi:hypothetical protein
LNVNIAIFDEMDKKYKEFVVNVKPTLAKIKVDS